MNSLRLFCLDRVDNCITQKFLMISATLLVYMRKIESNLFVDLGFVVDNPGIHRKRKNTQSITDVYKKLKKSLSFRGLFFSHPNISDNIYKSLICYIFGTYIHLFHQ